ncbi:MAG: hypothetical protein KF914_03865 [Rhizobiaceae bacterium]|nr:hypothetical protein [Rhizobiaceae bacterium]
MSDTDRLVRAGNFVFGLMDEAERRRAERDLEVDAAFRAAVNALSARIREADTTMAQARRSQPSWEAVSARLAELPHLRASGRSGAQSPGPGVAAGVQPPAARQSVWMVVLLAAALGLIAGFCAGYALGTGRPIAAGPTQSAEPG